MSSAHNPRLHTIITWCVENRRLNAAGRHLLRFLYPIMHCSSMNRSNNRYCSVKHRLCSLDFCERSAAFFLNIFVIFSLRDNCAFRSWSIHRSVILFLRIFCPHLSIRPPLTVCDVYLKALRLFFKRRQKMPILFARGGS